MATILNNTNLKHFHHHRKFYWTALQKLGYSGYVLRGPFIFYFILFIWGLERERENERVRAQEWGEGQRERTQGIRMTC